MSDIASRSSSVVRLDLLVAAFVLLLASVAFLAAITQASRVRGGEKAAPLAPPTAGPPEQPPQTITVKCEAPAAAPPPVPQKIFVDYGAHRAILDTQRELEFPPGDADVVDRSESGAQQYDAVYPERIDSLAVEGYDGADAASGLVAYHANDLVLAKTMHELDSNYVEVDGPTPLDFVPVDRTIPLAPIGDDDSTAATSTKSPPVASMDDFKYASSEGDSTLDLKSQLSAASSS